MTPLISFIVLSELTTFVLVVGLIIVAGLVGLVVGGLLVYFWVIKVFMDAISRAF